MSDKQLEGKIAVVTGGSRGIGFHIANAIHHAGATVAITGRDSETLKEAAQKIGERCHPYECDHTQPDQIKAMAAVVNDGIGVPDILVNNAGVHRTCPVIEMTLDQWNEVINTNLTGVFLTTQAFLPGMLNKNRGDIFMISSMSGKRGDPNDSAYAASKFGLQGFSQSLMYEVRRSNIRVMVLNPSSVDTRDVETPPHGPGLHLHAKDLADTIVHLATMAGRTLIRDMDIYGTNPFR